MSNTNDHDFLKQIAVAIQEAHRTGQLPETKNDILDGFSGESIIGCLQRFTQLMSGQQDVCYLEVGIFQGLTLLSTSLANPDIPCFGIDNFSLFDKDKENFDIVNKRKKELGIKNAHIINEDFEDALENLGNHIQKNHISVLFIDGPHDYRSQLVALLKAKHYLAENVVIIVDDSNYEHVRQANADFLSSNQDFALVFEAYTSSHPAHMSPLVKKEAMQGWWNGVNIFIRDTKGRIPRSLPPVGAKDRFFDSHEVFRHEFAEATIDTLRYGSVLVDGNESEEKKYRAQLKEHLTQQRKQHPERFPSQNTESKDLPDFKLHIGPF